MKRPAFQFYPKDWRANLKLNRCTDAAKGAWIQILCVLHDSEEYGVARFPLKELIAAAGVQAKSVRELVDKGVIKGGDSDVPSFVFVPRHGGREGAPVTLLEESKGPMWYSSRFVEDEYKRKNAGAETRFKPTNPSGGSPPSQPPTRRDGTDRGDGSAVASASAVRSINGLGVLAAGALDPPVDNPEPRRIESTSTPRAAAHSIANAQRVIEESRAAALAMAPIPESVRALIPKRPKGETDEAAA